MHIILNACKTAFKNFKPKDARCCWYKAESFNFAKYVSVTEFFVSNLQGIVVKFVQPPFFLYSSNEPHQNKFPSFRKAEHAQTERRDEVIFQASMSKETIYSPLKIKFLV